MVLTEFVKLREATTSFVRLSLRVSICPYRITELRKDGFYCNLILGTLIKICEIQLLLMTDKNWVII